tara:strand:+ start:2302 stop:2799 length:498 start_codon:yes stop_codon:yes gene_type:complete
MITKSINVPYFLTKLKNYEAVNKYYLNKINKGPVNSYGSIQNTDWHTKSHINYSYFLNEIKEHLDKMVAFFSLKECEVHNIWFQHYTKNGTHEWHTHGKANYTNVYYLKLGENKTKVRDPFTKETIDINVSTGNLLSFPAFLSHSSPPLKKQSTKTVFSFNTSFT